MSADDDAKELIGNGLASGLSPGRPFSFALRLRRALCLTSDLLLPLHCSPSPATSCWLDLHPTPFLFVTAS